MAVIHPPAAPPDPVDVYLLKDGRHTGLLLPTADGRIARYTYGEWEWYALIHKGPYRAVAALFWPTQATFGRHFYAGPPSEGRVRAIFGSDLTVYPVTVSMQKVQDLEARLNRRFDQQKDSLIANETYGLEFVKDPEPYWLFHDSNNEVAIWLRELGCEVKGLVLFANWRIASAAA